MVVSIFSRFFRWVGGRLPFLIALIACIAAIIPLHLPGDLEMTPLYPLICRGRRRACGRWFS